VLVTFSLFQYLGGELGARRSGETGRQKDREKKERQIDKEIE
jgi:hypothetical protein